MTPSGSASCEPCAPRLLERQLRTVGHQPANPIATTQSADLRAGRRTIPARRRSRCRRPIAGSRARAIRPSRVPGRVPPHMLNLSDPASPAIVTAAARAIQRSAATSRLATGLSGLITDAVVSRPSGCLIWSDGPTDVALEVEREHRQPVLRLGCVEPSLRDSELAFLIPAEVVGLGGRAGRGGRRWCLG